MASAPGTARPNEHPDESYPHLRQTHNALREAAERIRIATPDIAPGVAPQEVSCELRQLCDLIEHDSAQFSFGTDDAATRLLVRRRLLEMLRAETVHVWSEAPPNDAAYMMSVLRGFERVQAALESHPIYDEVRERIDDSRGLELVVELAHDLRSPLTSILFLSETLRHGASGPITEIQQRQLGIIYSAALGLIGTASDVIELAHGSGLEAGEAQVFSLTEIIEPVRDMVMPIAEEKGLEIRIQNGLPGHRRGFPIALSRVLLNLTTNALKFTDAGHVDLTARAVSPTRVELSVRDTGPGISDEARANLFQPIRRRSRGRPGYQITGTGLGLTICRKLVHAMGGTLELETRPNWGTRFYFELDLPPAE